MQPANPRHRVLFVCLGNICRSPAAEIIFRQQVADAGRTEEFEIDSAGTIGHHEGAPPDPRMSESLRQKGFTIRRTGKADPAGRPHHLRSDRDDGRVEPLRRAAAGRNRQPASRRSARSSASAATTTTSACRIPITAASVASTTSSGCWKTAARGSLSRWKGDEIRRDGD